MKAPTTLSNRAEFQSYLGTYLPVSHKASYCIPLILGFLICKIHTTVMPTHVYRTKLENIYKEM